MNNKAIQILRTSTAGITNNIKDVSILDGQPLYNEQKNYLTVGKGGTATAKDKPITVRELVGYFDDTDNNITSNTTKLYYIKPNSPQNELQIYNTCGDININATTDINLNTGSDSKIKLNDDTDIAGITKITNLSKWNPSNGSGGALQVSGSINAANMYIRGASGDTNVIRGSTVINSTGATGTNITLTHNSDQNSLILNVNGVQITNNTTATATGAALSVTGGIKSNNLYISGANQNIIRSTDTTTAGGTKIFGNTLIDSDVTEGGNSSGNITLRHNGSDNNKLILNDSGIQITKNTSANSSGGALQVTGGIKTSNLYISGENDSTINATTGKSIKLQYATNDRLRISSNGVDVLIAPISNTNVVRLDEITMNQDFFNSIY